MKKNQINYLDFAQELVKFAQKNGASQTQIAISTAKHFTVEVREGNIEKLQDSTSSTLSLKLIVNDKVATAQSSDLSKDTIEQLIKNSIKRANYSNPDKYASLPEKQKPSFSYNDLKIYDPTLEELPAERKISSAKEIEKIATSDSRIRLSLGSFFSTSIYEYYLSNSNGFAGVNKTSRCSAGVWLQSGEGENQYQDGAMESAISYQNLPQNEVIAKTAINRVCRMLGARKIESCKVPVVFEPRMTASLLGFLASCLHGSAIYTNRSFLVGKLGQKIAGDNITIIDDPTLVAYPGSRPFDAEGVPSQKTNVIQNGKLNNYLLDTYSAKKLNLKSTGNAGGATNFYLKEGIHSQEDIIKSVDKGFLLVNTIGQGTVPTTGDISRGAFGLWIEKGEISFPVMEITFSGNLADILNNIEMLGNDPEKNRNIFGPTIKVAELTLSGK